MSSLPSFLEPMEKQDGDHLPYRNAIFKHEPPLKPVHALWWSCKQIDNTPDIVLLFIPGNPGLLGFYLPFLTAIQDKASSTNLAILAHAHIGHTPGINSESDMDASIYGLTNQVQNAIEAFDAIKSTFSQKTKVVLLGHSIGSWFALQVLKARPKAVDGLFLLFPTISDIGNTPNGRSLSWIFRAPLPRIISTLSPIARMPASILSVLFWSWPRSQLTVIRSLLFSPVAIFAALSMGYEEMKIVRELDNALLEKHQKRIWFYYAEHDNWVGDQREVVLRVIDNELVSLRVVRGHRDIPHAFCINHGEQVADQCYEWLVSGGFI